jgi:hypothetical protein
VSLDALPYRKQQADEEIRIREGLYLVRVRVDAEGTWLFFRTVIVNEKAGFARATPAENHLVLFGREPGKMSADVDVHRILILTYAEAVLDEVRQFGDARVIERHRRSKKILVWRVVWHS